MKTIIFSASIMETIATGILNNGWLLKHDTLGQDTEKIGSTGTVRTIYFKKEFRKNKKVDFHMYVSDTGEIGFYASCPNTEGYEFSQESFINCEPEEITSYVKAYDLVKEQFLVKAMKDYFYTFQWNLEEVLEVMNSIQLLLLEDIDNGMKVLLLSIINDSIGKLQKYREVLINQKTI